MKPINLCVWIISYSKNKKKREWEEKTGCMIALNQLGCLIGIQLCMQTKSNQIFYQFWHNFWFIEFVFIYPVNNGVRKLKRFGGWIGDTMIRFFSRRNPHQLNEWIQWIEMNENKCVYCLQSVHRLEVENNLFTLDIWKLQWKGKFINHLNTIALS